VIALTSAAVVLTILAVASRWSDVFVGVREHAIFILISARL
jgi:hypothetical protein